MPEFSDYIEGLAAATGLTGAEIIGMSQGGDATKLTIDQLNPNRGDYAGGTDFPSTGGRYTGGVPMRGDRWRLTGVLTIGGVDIYAPGTILEAAISDPQDTDDWIKIQTL